MAAASGGSGRRMRVSGSSTSLHQMVWTETAFETTGAPAPTAATLPNITCTGEVLWNPQNTSNDSTSGPASPGGSLITAAPWSDVGSGRTDPPKVDPHRYRATLSHQTLTLVGLRGGREKKYSLVPKSQVRVFRLAPRELNRRYDKGIGVRVFARGTRGREITLRLTPTSFECEANGALADGAQTELFTHLDETAALQFWERHLAVATFLADPAAAEEQLKLTDVAAFKCSARGSPRKLGSGAMGDGVFHVQKEGVPVAVKRLLHLDLRCGIADIFFEAVVLSSLQHPNIAGYQGLAWDSADAGATMHCVDPHGEVRFVGPRHYHLAMEYCPGGTLESWVLDAHGRPRELNPLGFGSFALQRIAVEMMSALAYLREQGYVHSDLKLANCGMMHHAHRVVSVSHTPESGLSFEPLDGWNEGPLLKLIDFGVAHTLHDTGASVTEFASTRPVRGTSEYKDPQILFGGGKVWVDGWSDSYSAAVCLLAVMAQSQGVAICVQSAVEKLATDHRRGVLNAAKLKVDTPSVVGVEDAVLHELDDGGYSALADQLGTTWLLRLLAHCWHPLYDEPCEIVGAGASASRFSPPPPSTAQSARYSAADAADMLTDIGARLFDRMNLLETPPTFAVDPQDPADLVLNTFVCGPTNSGKTCLAHRLHDPAWHTPGTKLPPVKMTVGCDLMDSQVVDAERVDGTAVRARLRLWDMRGTERHGPTNVINSFFRRTGEGSPHDAFIFVYDIFQEIPGAAPGSAGLVDVLMDFFDRTDICDRKGAAAPVYLIGNKFDLSKFVQDGRDSEEGRRLKEVFAETKAAQLEFVRRLNQRGIHVVTDQTVSCKDDRNEVFANIVKTIAETHMLNFAGHVPDDDSGSGSFVMVNAQAAGRKEKSGSCCS